MFNFGGPIRQIETTELIMMLEMVCGEYSWLTNEGSIQLVLEACQTHLLASKSSEPRKRIRQTGTIIMLQGEENPDNPLEQTIVGPRAGPKTF
jgi:hypothetical protein